jgi:chorismate mutase/prephenate dehydratase
MEDLSEIRDRIDTIDDDIVKLFQERMAATNAVAEYKRANGLPVLDRARERQKLADVSEKVPDDLRDYTTVLFSLLMEVSRSHQNALLGTSSAVGDRISEALGNTPDLFPQQAYVACQGVEGAYSQIAADRIFKHPNITYMESFDGVFRAVEQGLCKYGILPVENSTAGTVNQVYDLMMEHEFSIVRSTRLKVDHNLLAKRGTTLADVRDIYSHEQAIEQCSAFLAGLDGVRVHVVENTAIAARSVAESDRDDVAALSSRSCAELYGLESLAKSVQDKGNNFTRFACISKDLEIYRGADRTSLMMVVAHEPGSLYKVLARFYSLDINLVKLESRPIPDRDFEFMFYFDLECPARAPEFATLMNSLDDVCEEFRYLGSYSEVI